MWKHKNEWVNYLWFIAVNWEKIYDWMLVLRVVVPEHL